MSYVDPEFPPPTIPEHERYEGTEIDENVLDGTRVLWVATHGASFWAISTKIDAELAGGSKKSYFMKTYNTERARAQAIGEYESTKALFAIIPDNVPRPVAVGTLASNPQRHFLLVEFKNMAEELPPVPEFVAVIAALHQRSSSPNGKFGFQVPTSQSLQLNNTWSDTWEEFFTRAFRGTVDLERAIQGHNGELQELAEKMYTKVIPRLLRPMESGGRSLKPTLVHGDLWHGNVGVDTDTDKPILFDCCAFYGHHEYDLGMWRATRYKTNNSHVRAYHKLIEMSPPAEDHDDRNALYALRVDLEVSYAWPNNERMRALAMGEMRRLISKYPNGLDGYTL